MIPTQSIIKAYKNTSDANKASYHLLDVKAEGGLKKTTSKATYNTSSPKSFPEVLKSKISKHE